MTRKERVLQASALFRGGISAIADALEDERVCTAWAIRAAIEMERKVMRDRVAMTTDEDNKKYCCMVAHGLQRALDKCALILGDVENG